MPTVIKSPHHKNFIYMFLITGVLCLLLFVAAEIIVRFTRPHVDLMGLTGRIPIPNPMSLWAQQDAFSAYKGRPGNYNSTESAKKTVNSQGFISTPELTVSKPPNTIRIVFLGGSSTAGTGINLANEDTWPWQTSSQLQNQFKDLNIQFINAGLGGYSTFESYGRLWSRLRFYAPDIIIVYHGWNDMYYFHDADQIVSWRTNADGAWGFQNKINAKPIWAPLWLDNIIWPSQILVKARLLLTSRVEAGEIGKRDTKPLSTTFDPKGLDIFRTNLKLIKSTSTIINAKLFVAKQATLIVPGLAQIDRDRCNYDLHGFDHDAHLKAFDLIYGIIDDEIDKTDVIDLTSLSGQSSLFHDHIHPTVAGAKEISNIVSNFLYNYLKSSLEPHPK